MNGFGIMLQLLCVFDFGKSFFKGRPVIDLILEKMPVSISIGLWTTLIGYLVSIPLGIAKARRDGSSFDSSTTPLSRPASAIPAFLFAVLLIVLFAGGSYFHWFPLRGLVSDNWWDLSWPDRIRDYFWHMTLPLIAMTIGGFAASTLLVKNSFLDQMNLLYVSTARAKGLTQTAGSLWPCFSERDADCCRRNARCDHQHLSRVIDFSSKPSSRSMVWGCSAMRPPSAATIPSCSARCFLLSIIGLLIGLVSDLTYTLVDPRIDFERRET